jgi:hypothetical protein
MESGWDWCKTDMKLGDYQQASCLCGAAKDPGITNNVGRCAGPGADSNITCSTPGAVISTVDEGGFLGIKERGLTCTPVNHPPPAAPCGILGNACCASGSPCVPYNNQTLACQDGYCDFPDPVSPPFCKDDKQRENHMAWLVRNKPMTCKDAQIEIDKECDGA